MEIEKTCKVEEIIPILFNLDRNVEYDVSIKEHREKRSLNANAYCWLLINKIANELRISKEDCYKRMLNDYGQSDMVTLASYVPIEKYFKYYQEESRNGLYAIYKVFRGSSTYNTKEMSILIDGIVMEAKNLGIETLTTDRINILKDTWDENNK